MRRSIKALVITVLVMICAAIALKALTVADPEVPPTCTSTGLSEGKHLALFSITIKEQEVIPALGHDLIHHEGNNPTCTESGYASYDTCSRCDYSTFSEKPALGHKLVHYAGRDATCTEKGYALYEKCLNCDYSTFTEIPALGHDFAGGRCTRCGLEYALYCALEEIVKTGPERVSNDNVGYNFFHSQQDTGTYSDSNCGPACTYMAAKWADESFSASVEDIRNLNVKPSPFDYGWFPQTVSQALNTYGINNRVFHVGSAEAAVEEMKRLIDDGKLLIVCFDRKDIFVIKEDPHLESTTGTDYRAKSAGHFIVVKGYWIVDGVMYFEIYDPGFLDKTGYYDAGELVKAIVGWNKDTVIVSRRNSQ